jgi:hypothetical protein
MKSCLVSARFKSRPLYVLLDCCPSSRYVGSFHTKRGGKTSLVLHSLLLQECIFYKSKLNKNLPKIEQYDSCPPGPQSHNLVKYIDLQCRNSKKGGRNCKGAIMCWFFRTLRNHRAFRTRPFRRTRTQTEVRNSDSDF